MKEPGLYGPKERGSDDRKRIKGKIDDERRDDFRVLSGGKRRLSLPKERLFELRRKGEEYRSSQG